MSTRVPITIEGNLVADPTFAESTNGTKLAKFTVAVTDRKLEDGKWVDGETQFHRVTAFGRLAENVRASLTKGDSVLVSGNLEFRHWVDEHTGEARSSTEVVADAVGPSLRYNRVEVARRPSIDGAAPAGPVLQPPPSPGASASVAQ
ncbi:single-stranded DNA-binding protein [Gryllotalpicola protaetiae]|uniref:Single-stranded DNA-binding protein n=1 Tax=Gryllotalpicola protaetiae TaxID=2419771 RepID=A0A387BS52_9MICO|nr:single-stranded DNA-binding protein [Gryllotalpicola protaetiae]AYG03880.1 single-stranded DNA-binding protein [Gryllotalpicola protaetiae]